MKSDELILQFFFLLVGSCMDAGYTECCRPGSSTCVGTPGGACYCDVSCHSFGDCCDDIDEICSGPTQLEDLGMYVSMIIIG